MIAQGFPQGTRDEITQARDDKVAEIDSAIEALESKITALEKAAAEADTHEEADIQVERLIRNYQETVSLFIEKTSVTDESLGNLDAQLKKMRVKISAASKEKTKIKKHIGVEHMSHEERKSILYDKQIKAFNEGYRTPTSNDVLHKFSNYGCHKARQLIILMIHS